METPRTAGIILAAGASRRFGRPKQLVNFRGKPLLEWVIDAAAHSDLDTIILILGHAHDEILERLDERLLEADISTFINHEYPSGQSSSLKIGLSMVRGDHQAAIFLPGDQPLITSQLINQLIDAFWKSPKTIAAPVYGGRRGAPAIFGRRHFDALMQTEGDRGGRGLIETHAGDVLEVETGDPHMLADIDTPEDLTRLQALKDEW
jgi:molybdenum cofactor cytidylyltransferase